MLITEKPRIDKLSFQDTLAYIVGLSMIGSLLSEDFFDIPRLVNRADRFSKSGLFFNIPYFDDDTLYTLDNKRSLLVVYKLGDGSSWCPLSIDFQFFDDKNFKLIINDQSGQRTKRKSLIFSNGGTMHSEYVDYAKLTLSQLMENSV